MAKRLIAVDCGTWSLKFTAIDLKDGRELQTDEIRLPDPIPTSSEPNAPEAEVESEIIDPLVAALQELTAIVAPGNDDGWILTMPNSEAMVVTVEVPFPERNKVSSVLPHLLTDRLPLPVSEVVHDFQVQSHDEKHRAVVGFARKSDVQHTLERLKGANIDPNRLAVSEQALAMGARELLRNPELPVAVLDIGHRHARLVVVARDRTLLAHTTLIAGHAITTKIAKAFRAPYDEAERAKHQHGVILRAADANPQIQLMHDAVTDALKPLIRDVRRTLQSLFAQDQVEVQGLYLVGGTSRIRGIDAWFTREIGIETQILNTKTTSIINHALKHGMSEKEGTRLLNLRQGVFAFRGSSPYLRKQALVFGLAAVIMFAMIGASLFLQKQAQEARRDAMKAALMKETDALLGEKLFKRTDIQARLEGGESGVQSFVPKMSAYELMYRITSAISPSTPLTLTRFEVDIDRKIIQIVGETSDAQAVDSIVSDLESLECLQNIKKDKVRVKNDGKADFEIQIASECS